jgi:hypothetical protein
MAPRFDVFSRRKDQSLMWLGASNELSELKRLVLDQPFEAGSAVSVFDNRTGQMPKMTFAELQKLKEIP